MANKTIYPYGVGGQTPSGIEIVDYTTGGNDKAASAESVKELAQHVFMGSGTFADAYDKSRGSTVNFPWLLVDTDEEGNPIKKMIWHTGNGKFIDAIGAEIDGKINGVEIVCDAECEVVINGNTFSLSQGKNKIPFFDIGSNTASSFSFQDVNNINAKTAVVGIDFGWMTVIVTQTVWMMGFTKLRYVKRLNALFGTGSYTYQVFHNAASCEYVQMSGSGRPNSCSIFGWNLYVPQVKVFDLKGFNVNPINKSLSIGKSCPAKEVNIEDLDTSNLEVLELPNNSGLEKLIIGNLSNVNMSRKINLGATNAVLVCKTTTPPVLKNCSFTDSTPNDEHSSTYDWVEGHFTDIYVPDEAVQAYKTNVYVENGTVGNTGWSFYADIIKPISEYDG